MSLVGPDIDEADLERLLAPGGAQPGGEAEAGGGGAEDEAAAPEVERHVLFSLVVDGMGQVAGRNGLPRQAGASSLPRTEPAEMMVSTRMVAR